MERSVDLVTAAGVADVFYEEIKETKPLLYEHRRRAVLRMQGLIV